MAVDRAELKGTSWDGLEESFRMRDLIRMYPRAALHSVLKLLRKARLCASELSYKAMLGAPPP